MKNKRSAAILIAILLIAVLSISAYAVYHSIVLPNSEELQMQRSLKLLENAVQGKEVERFEKELDKLSDEMLLQVIAEAAQRFDDEDTGAEMVLFAPEAMERIGPKVMPEDLKSILTDEAYPDVFKEFMLEVTLLSHGEMGEDSTFTPDPAYEKIIRTMLVEESFSDIVTAKLISSVQWDVESEYLQGLLDSDKDLPLAKRRALQTLTFADPNGMKDQLFEMAGSFEKLDGQEIRALYDSLYLLKSVDGNNQAMELTKKVLQNAKTVDDPLLFLSLSNTALMMGTSHQKGVVLLVKEYQDVISQREDYQLEDVLNHLSDYLFPEVDDLLLSDDPEEVAWALKWVEESTYEYYIENLELLRTRFDGEFAAQAEDLIKRAREEQLYMPRADLAIKEGIWNERDRQSY